MSNAEIRIARRVMTYMLEVSEQQVDLNFFMGLGLALGVVYEELTGKSVQNMKPREIIEWAKSLPHVPYPKVTIVQ